MAFSVYGVDLSQYKNLRKIIRTNSGVVHFTRGMNICTIIALKDAVTEKDLDLLVELLDDKDQIVAMTSGNVLNSFGEVGRLKLKARLQQAISSKDTKKQSQLEDYLQAPVLSVERIRLARIQECKKSKI